MPSSFNRRELLKNSMMLAGAAGFANEAASAEHGDSQTDGIRSGTHLAQDHVNIFHNADPNLYVEGCGIERLSDGSLIAVVPVVPRASKGGWAAFPSITYIFRSDDAGQAWNLQSELPYYTAVPWVHENALYLFACKAGTKYRNDDLFLLRSDDRGASWTKPVTLLEGHFWNCHTGMVKRGGKIYWPLCDFYGTRGTAPRGPFVLEGDLTREPLDPASWRRSNYVPFPDVPEVLGNPAYGKPKGMYLEPNIIDVHGKLRVLSTVKINSQSTAGLCAVLDLGTGGGKLDLSFLQFHPMPVGQLKFCVRRDEKSGLFWCTGNLVVDSQNIVGFWGNQGSRTSGGNDRRFLMLLYGLDGLNWMQAGCIAQANGLKQSYMYGAFTIDGSDLAVISRTSKNAPDQHDADYATFHRVRNFRDLALTLTPTA